MVKRFSFSILACLLSACGAMGYMNNNDPITKTQEAYSLMDQGRFLMAEDYLLSSLKALKEKPNTETAAEVHAALGGLYKHPGYHQFRRKYPDSRMPKGFAKYDPTYMNSIKHFQKAIELFKKANSDIGVAKSLIGLGQAYDSKGDHIKSCSSYKKSLSIYNNGRKDGRITFEPVLFTKNYKTLGEVAMAFICSKCIKQPWTSKEDCFAKFKQ